jgi:hypothetical protein
MTTDAYGDLYFYEQYDEYRQMESRKPGWPTTLKTNFFAVAGLATSLLQSSIHLRSQICSTLLWIPVWLRLCRTQPIQNSMILSDSGRIDAKHA